MTKSEEAGRKKLRKRCESGEIVCVRTDKSDKVAVVTSEMYDEMGDVHVDKDKVVDWKKVEEIKEVVNGHLKALNRVFRTGENHGEKAMRRAWRAKEAKATILPLLHLLVKDHKEVGEGQNPKTRPVCGAATGINGELSEWIADIVEAALQGVDNKEVISTEEMLAHVDRVNKEWEE